MAFRATMDMHMVVLAPRASLRPVPLRIRQPPKVLRQIANLLGDQRPAFVP